jgi:hypothetical protein
VKPQAALSFALVTLELDRTATFGIAAAHLLDRPAAQTTDRLVFIERHVDLGFFRSGRQRRRWKTWSLNLRDFRRLWDLRQLELRRRGNRRQWRDAEQLTAKRTARENDGGKRHAKSNELA